MPDRLVLVSGMPGSGKSTLAGPLAEALGFPLLSKDVIKEQLHDTLGDIDADPSESSRRLGAASMELLWRLAVDHPELILEANFRPDDYQRSRIRQLHERPVEVHCTCPPDVALRRFAHRVDTRHPAHAGRTFTKDDLADYPGPVGLGPVISVDTMQAIDVGALAEQVRAELS